MDPLIPAGCHIDILAIPRLSLVQCTHEKQVDRAREVISRGMMVHWQDRLRIDWLREVIAEDLLPVA